MGRARWVRHQSQSQLDLGPTPAGSPCTSSPLVENVSKLVRRRHMDILLNFSLVLQITPKTERPISLLPWFFWHENKSCVYVYAPLTKTPEPTELSPKPKEQTLGVPLYSIRLVGFFKPKMLGILKIPLKIRQLILPRLVCCNSWPMTRGPLVLFCWELETTFWNYSNY